MSSQEDMIVSASPEIPDKLYFRIGDVARLAGIKPYVLRFWETEFPGLGPKKSGTGHRLYRRKDVELVLEIKRLLYEQRFTIEGARKFLETRAKPEVVPSPAAPAACAVRMIAPKLCGSSTPSKITCNPPDAAVSSIDEYFSAAPNAMTPW